MSIVCGCGYVQQSVSEFIPIAVLKHLIEKVEKNYGNV